MEKQLLDRSKGVNPRVGIFKSDVLEWIPTGKLFDLIAPSKWMKAADTINQCLQKEHRLIKNAGTVMSITGKSQSMVAEKADISETIVKVDSQMMIQKK
ncbi:hypothetical protein Tco_0752679 [Tanacetum coccineum]|uniref:Uncharacterized protein n=1 Tax=Tanacetum coccineum TaxID=301880 RepID=A0ABQ4ZBA1_9ASTR